MATMDDDDLTDDHMRLLEWLVQQGAPEAVQKEPRSAAPGVFMHSVPAVALDASELAGHLSPLQAAGV